MLVANVFLAEQHQSVSVGVAVEVLWHFLFLNALQKKPALTKNAKQLPSAVFGDKQEVAR